MSEAKLPEAPSDTVIEAFVLAAATAFQELTQCESLVEPAAMEATAEDEPVVAARIQLQRTTAGEFCLLAPVPTAARLARRYLPESTELNDVMVDDVLGEFANVIAGQAKTVLKLTPYHFLISPPQVSRRRGHPPGSAKPAPLVLRVGNELGEFWLAIVLPACDGA